MTKVKGDQIKRSITLRVVALTVAPLAAVVAQQPPVPVPVGEVFTEAAVDEPPERVSCPRLEYPADMRAANIEGSVTVRFVVDPMGGVEPGSVEIVESSHEAFHASVEAMIVECLFRPGFAAGTAVRVLVQLAVTFNLEDRPAGPEMRISAILLATRDEAEQILERLQGGDDFATLAETHTTGPGKDVGGDIGYFGPDELISELNGVAVGLEVSQHSDIIETETGFFIIMKTGERIPARRAEGQSIESLRVSCDDGNVTACTDLGFLYQSGVGVPQDSPRAAALFQQACNGGEMWGCSNLGLLYQSGDGVPQDAPRAARLFQQACDGGEMLGCSNLALLYQSGDGVPQDSARATSLLQQACDGGLSEACKKE